MSIHRLRIVVIEVVQVLFHPHGVGGWQHVIVKEAARNRITSRVDVDRESG